MRAEQCELLVEHNGHSRSIVETERCSGTTLCGHVDHPAHEIKVDREVWCNGLCFCGMRSGTHGPGAHK